jgi:hypothetical protein
VASMAPRILKLLFGLAGKSHYDIRQTAWHG